MGKATERLFLPLIQLFLPEIVDFAMPAPGVFHNLVLVSIKKRFPGHAQQGDPRAVGAGVAQPGEGYRRRG